MRKYAIIVILGTLLILSSSTVASDNTDVSVVDSPVSLERIHEVSYVSHGEIYISSDNDFDIQAAAEGWAGGGNATHPYIIEGYEISFDANNILISGTSRHFIIRNCNLIPDLNPGINMGLYLLMTPNAQIDNVTVSQKGGGFYLYDSPNLVVTDSKADSCDEGFYIRYSENSQLSDLEAQNCEVGIEIIDSDDVTFDVGSIHDNDRGLSVYNSDNLQLSNLEVNDNTYEGILIDTSNYCQLEDTTIYNCGDHQYAGFNCTNSNYFTAVNVETWSITQGFWLEDSFQPTIEDSYFHSGYQTGIAIWGCSEVTISRTQVESNLYMGIGIYNTLTSLIEYCDISYNSWQGVYLSLSSYCTIAHSTIGNDGDSFGYSEIETDDSDYLTLFNNSISWNRNEDGVRLQTSDYANITGNTINNNVMSGVYLLLSEHCTLDNNTIFLNGDDGIHLNEAHDTYMNDQTVYDNGIYGIGIDGSNDVSVSGSEISFNTDNGIDIDSSNDSIVRHNQIYNNSFFGIRTQNVMRIEVSFCDIYLNFYEGIYMHNTDNSMVSYSDFWQNGGGDCEITLDNSQYVTILRNTLIGNRVTQGMYATFSHHLNITGNTIVGNFDDGMNIQNSNYTYIANNNISFNGKTGLYLWESDFCIIIDNTIQGNGDTGVYITGCLNCTLTNNEISENRLDGVYSKDSPNLVLEFNIIFDNGWIDPGNPRSGVYLSTSDNCILDHNVIYNNTVHGIYLVDSDGCLVTDNTIYGNLGMTSPGCGIYLDDSDFTIIIDNTIYDNARDGIYVFHSDVCEILDNIIYSNEWIGINAGYSNSCIIQGNEIYDQVMSVGIHLVGCYYFVIDSNELYENEMGGVRFYVSNYCNFTNNLVHHNPVVGVQVDTSNNTLIHGNIIFDNYQWGLTLQYANDTRIFNNDFVLNVLRDAVEYLSTGANYWDDGVSIGNYWWGISRTLANYTIHDFSMVPTNVDNYPLTSMWIEDALASSYEIISTGNTVAWTAFAFNPFYYEVYEGATLFGTGSWTGSDISVNIDGLSAGLHSLEIVIYHISGNSLSAFVEVTVEDATPPTWVSTPTDQEIEFGETLSYQLYATDASGIQSWAVNDTVNFMIVDGLLTNNIALDVGTHNVQITVEDPYGNELSVIITITVTEPPMGGDMMLIIIAAGGGLAVLVIIIVIVSKKKGS